MASEENVTLTEEQVTKVQQLFSCFDANKDEKIDLAELHAQLSASYENEEAEKEGIAKFMKRYDENNDGVVTMDEVKNYVLAIKTRLAKREKADQIDNILDNMLKEQLGKVTPEERELVDKYFALFDTNEDNKISLEEVVDQLNDEDMRLKAFLSRFDANKDGLVSHTEVMLYCVNTKVRIAKNKNVDLSKILTNMIEAQKPKLNTLEKHKVKQLFLCYDANEDGKIELEEIHKQLSASYDGAEEAKEAMDGFFKRYDANEDGVVTLDEMEGYVLGIKERLAKRNKEDQMPKILDKMINEQCGKVTPEERELVDQYFNLFDKNADNTIQLEEVKDQLNDEGIRLKGFLKRFDANKDGLVSKTEVLLYCVNTKVRIANNPNVDLSKILTNMINSQTKEAAGEN